MTVKIKIRIPNDWVRTTSNDPIHIFADCYVETEEYFEPIIKMLYLPGYLASNIKADHWADIYSLIDQKAIDKYCELREIGVQYEEYTNE
jgi:hypothetical protein